LNLFMSIFIRGDIFFCLSFTFQPGNLAEGGKLPVPGSQSLGTG